MNAADLLTVFQAAHQRAVAYQRPVIAVSAYPAPTLAPLALYAAHRQGFFWCAHSPDLSLFGLGCAWQIEACGPGRMAEVDRQWFALCADALVQGPYPAVLLGGMRFDEQQSCASHWAPFADASFQLAHWLLSEDATGRWLRCQRVVEPGSDPAALVQESLAVYEQLLNPAPHVTSTPDVLERRALPRHQWQAKVDTALHAIAGGELNKVVLARHIDHHLDATLDTGAVMGRLHERRNASHLFAIHRGEHCFMGATPERLLSCDAGRLTTHALAGSTRRGLWPDEDQALGERLLADPKEQHEHQLVVQTITQALHDKVTDLHAAPCPGLLKLATVQHLSTPITAQLNVGKRLLDGVQALHPTPAVGGLPRAPALGFIRGHEGFDRGWYAAPVGWLDANGNGDFLVALRSALITPRHCHAFAGCGIVEGSLPANEYEETQIKLASMQQALQLACPADTDVAYSQTHDETPYASTAQR
ncbi:isochorismate synthase [Pseudomonas synxantha]|uniref:isochorismate synthase n=1 Tax=Pseudomonas synxantha TaxID=47883 RepID=A0AAX3I9S1_9PSED|nr:isochorismate synthase [Pseudomonas synxantha]KRP46524.1 isochorismate synthase [Pseudomonas synxantha]SDU37928.1 isochorismate synthase [Pseudomonas synxantha]VTR00811.1 salicylate biosynthesis isochorismate synthase [Pseudomonas synxantha]